MIYVEKSAASLPLTVLAEKTGAEMRLIEDGEPVEDVKSNIVITAAKDNFIRRCPGTNIYRCCSYHVADIMQGCPFDCSYCVLQTYLSHKHIRVSGDTRSFIKAVNESVSCGIRRIGTGELADSLALDGRIPLSKIIMPLANKGKDVQFEFKTKSAAVGNLLEINPENGLVSWSLNPQKIISAEEPGTASLKKRLNAAAQCARHGYRVAFHMDPLIMTENFEALYGELIEEMAEAVPESSVEFVSLSTFRCPSELMDAIRLRKTRSILVKGDFIKGLDGKIRYFKSLRAAMLRFAAEKIKKRWKKPFIYFCMEHESLWIKILGRDPGPREDFENLFPLYGGGKVRGNPSADLDSLFCRKSDNP